MNKDDVRFMIWALKQDNLRRGDILERANDEAFKVAVREQMNKAEDEIRALAAELIKMEVCNGN